MECKCPDIVRALNPMTTFVFDAFNSANCSCLASSFVNKTGVPYFMNCNCSDFASFVYPFTSMSHGTVNASCTCQPPSNSYSAAENLGIIAFVLVILHLILVVCYYIVQSYLADFYGEQMRQEYENGNGV